MCIKVFCLPDLGSCKDLWARLVSSSLSLGMLPLLLQIIVTIFVCRDEMNGYRVVTSVADGPWPIVNPDKKQIVLASTKEWCNAPVPPQYPSPTLLSSFYLLPLSTGIVGGIFAFSLWNLFFITILEIWLDCEVTQKLLSVERILEISNINNFYDWISAIPN